MRPDEIKPPTPWHSLGPDDALAALESHQDGLSEDEAARRLGRYGPNRLPETKRRSAFARLIAQFDNMLIVVLLMAGAASAALEHWIDSAVIFAVVIVNAAIGYFQEGRAERTLEAIKGLLAPHCAVMREGVRREIGLEVLVPGDIVLLRSGDRLPADVRLLRSHAFAVQEAALTGESLPVEKSIEAVNAGAPLAERIGMAFAGTLVVHGRAIAVVAETGARTELGRVSALVAAAKPLETPLLRQMARFGRTLTGAILALATVSVLIAVLVHGTPATTAFMAAVGLAVAAIPEGLPAILSITLAIGVIRMARRHAIIRRLPAVETLGAVSVICSDKTGTLTRNELIVQDLIGAAGAYKITGESLGAPGAIIRNGQPLTGESDPDLGLALAIAVHCNDAELSVVEGEWKTLGNPVDGALLALAHKGGVEIAAAKAAHPRIDTIPFESDHKFMATLHRANDGSHVIYVKGAPERVIEMCGAQRESGETRPLDPAYWHAQTHELATSGRRVLALAFRPVPGTQRSLGFADVETGLVMVALAGVADPPREEVAAAISACRSAGIAVKIITGDHPATAAMIARSIGLAERPEVLTGAALDRIGEADLVATVAATDVFARTTPEHKLRIVRALQSEGAIVAMTGDGVNDAPALKRADIGVAMGRRGTEAAKEASGMVLLDDNFASIVHAVEEGRTVYDNLTKALLFILPTSVGEALMVALAMLFGFTLPVTPVQILWVNTVTEITLSLAFAFERAEPDTMRRPPRAPDAPLLSPLLIWRLAFVTVILVAMGLGAFFWQIEAGASIETARTMVVNLLVFGEMVYLLNVRRILAPAWSGPGLWLNRVGVAALIGVALVQVLFTHLPEAHGVFGSASLGVTQWGVVLAAGAVLFTLVELEKRVLRAFRVAGRSKSGLDAR